MKNVLTVKQAAKILGVSTNTMYKYLNENRIMASRGHKRASFRIPARSLENFLGTKLTEDMFVRVDRPEIEETMVETAAVNPASLPVKVVRYLLLAALVLVIVDIVTTKNFSFFPQVGRLVILFVLTLLSYQFGGFVKR